MLVTGSFSDHNNKFDRIKSDPDFREEEIRIDCDDTILKGDEGTPLQKHTLLILHTNDMHGQVNPYNPDSMISEDDPEKQVGGFAHLSAAVNEIRKENPESTLLLDGGDIVTGAPVSDMFKTEPMIMAMNQIGYDAMTIGNHEFNRGIDYLKNLSEKAEFPFLSANLVSNPENKDEIKSSPYIMKEVNGVKVGIFGLSRESSLSVLNSEDRKKFEITSAIETAEKSFPECGKKVQTS
jgi:2',3'-cyclic-nucleotide 2'-phosphodiesterase (5'-nucleotidase family)